MSDDELRTALRTLGAPGTPPPGARDGIAAAVQRRHRARRWASVGLAAVAAATVAGVAASGILDGRDDRPDLATADRPTTTAPYDAAGCSETLPDLPEANHRLPDLSQVEAVRLCTDDRDYGFSARPEELAAITDPEALVHEVDRFVAGVEALAAADPARCAAISVGLTRTSLQLALSDGSTVLVPAGSCLDVQLGDRTLDAGDVTNAFESALDAQRWTYDYSRTVDARLTCRVLGEPGPVEPGREQLVDAIRCGDHDEATGDHPPAPLSDDAFMRVQEAWAAAYRHDHTDEEAEPGECTGADDEAESVVARTDRGDVVTLRTTRCDYLVLDGWEPGTSWAVPIRLDDL